MTATKMLHAFRLSAQAVKSLAELQAKTGITKTAIVEYALASLNNELKGSKMNTMKYNRNGVWQNYWGEMPLPQGSEAIGLIQRDGEMTAGALIKLENGNYVQGNAGSIRNLPKAEVERLIAISAVAEY